MLGADDSLAPLEGSRILVIRAGALGDTILALPAIASLRRAAGQAGRVELIGSLPAASLALDEGYAAAVHSFDRALFSGFFHASSGDDALGDFLASFDVIVAWSRLPRLHGLVRGATIVESSPRPGNGVHACDHLLLTLSTLGIEPACRAPRLAPSDASRASAAAFLESAGVKDTRFVAIHPSSGSPSKNWPAERFVSFARRATQAGLAPVWIEGESDEQVVPALARQAPGIVARRLDLWVLAALLSRAAIYIGNDSGVSHLAAATGTPTLVLFGPTDPTCWCPRGPRVEVVPWHSSDQSVWGKADKMLQGY